MTFLLLFLPVVLLLYFLAPGLKGKNAVLICASLLFYAWGEPVCVLAMLASTAVNYACARLIGASQEPRKRKAACAVGVGVSLALLGYFKYFAFLLENLATYVFTGRPLHFPDIPFLSSMISVGGVQIQAICLFIPIVTVICLTVLLHIVNHTKTGMAMRAVSKDYEIARVMGVNIDNIISITFAIGSSLAAIGAIMWGIRYPGITPYLGVMPGLKCFIAAVIGGIGNIRLLHARRGAMLGAPGREPFQVPRAAKDIPLRSCRQQQQDANKALAPVRDLAALGRIEAGATRHGSSCQRM